MTCIEACDGEEAFKLAKENAEELACAILDVRMPRSDGFQTLENIRRDASTRLLPVVLLTANATGDEDIIRGASLLATDHLAKPFSGRVLMAKVSAIVARTKLWREVLSAPVTPDDGKPNAEAEDANSLAPPSFRVGDRVQICDAVLSGDEHLIGLYGMVIDIVGDGLVVQFDHYWEGSPREIMFPRELRKC